MKLSDAVDLGRSLQRVFGDDPISAHHVEQDRDRQIKTTNAILNRFFSPGLADRRELLILADEVGLGKTYVALAAAVSILDAIRRNEGPEELPANRPVVLVLTPNNQALFNKWMREAEAFKRDCARNEGDLDWLDIRCPNENSTKSGNIVDMTFAIRSASRSRPMLLIAKESALGAALIDHNWWRRRALAVVFESFNIKPEDRRLWCRAILGSASRANVAELLDLRRSDSLWSEWSEITWDLRSAFRRAIDNRNIRDRLDRCLRNRKTSDLKYLLDDLARMALIDDWPLLPLVIIDEIHGLKNENVQVRRHFERFLYKKVCRLLGLSATPFQLRHDELLSILKLRCVLSVKPERCGTLDRVAGQLSDVMTTARQSGAAFSRRWLALQSNDKELVATAWATISKLPERERIEQAQQIRPPKLAHAIEAALALEFSNKELCQHLSPFVIRHHHERGYRRYFIGRHAEAGNTDGSAHFSWFPGIEVRGNAELAHYLMMRAVALAKDEKGLPSLGAELTGSYHHLVQTSAVWKRLANAKNPLLRDYRLVLDKMIGAPGADHEHRKIQTTVRRAMDSFKHGQKTLIFCVYTKTAESVRDELQQAVSDYLHDALVRVFGDETAFKNFRQRFFNRREPLYSLIQDHPLLERRIGGAGIPRDLGLHETDLRDVARILLENGEAPNTEKPDRRLLLAAIEHVAVRKWREHKEGQIWLDVVLKNCRDLIERISDISWLKNREPLARGKRGGREQALSDPEASASSADPLDVEQIEDDEPKKTFDPTSKTEVEKWVRRLREDAIGGVIAPYLADASKGSLSDQLPLLILHHGDLLTALDTKTRATCGQVFRRALMAEEFLLRYVADVERNSTEKWADYISDRYVRPLETNGETLRDRVHAYIETLVRAQQNEAMLAGYHDAAENRNVVQLVQGNTKTRDRYFLGFNTPYRPEIMISTSVGQEGIDLHRECRHVIHHDLCWNPATIEQRTGRVDRIGSKVERERLHGDVTNPPNLEIAVPYLAATYDERMFEELYHRAQLFEVTMGGDMRVDGRIDKKQVETERRQRERLGIGTEDEDLGLEPDTHNGAVELPEDMIERLRVNLAVWKPHDSA